MSETLTQAQIDRLHDQLASQSSGNANRRAPKVLREQLHDLITPRPMPVRVARTPPPLSVPAGSCRNSAASLLDLGPLGWAGRFDPDLRGLLSGPGPPARSPAWDQS